MELDEFKATLQRMEVALEHGNRLRAEILRRQDTDARRQSLNPLKWSQIFQILFGVLFILLAGSLWATKPTAFSIILSGVIVQAYGIGCVITAGVVLTSVNRIDYSKPVTNVQSRLANVKKTYGISVLIAGLSWWFLWIPLLMLLLGLVHINLYSHAPSVIWIGATIGVVGLLGTFWMYRYSVNSRNDRLRRFVEQAAFGRSLTNAVEQIAEIKNFEDTTTPMEL